MNNDEFKKCHLNFIKTIFVDKCLQELYLNSDGRENTNDNLWSKKGLVNSLQSIPTPRISLHTELLKSKLNNYTSSDLECVHSLQIILFRLIWNFILVMVSKQGQKSEFINKTKMSHKKMNKILNLIPLGKSTP